MPAGKKKSGGKSLGDANEIEKQTFIFANGERYEGQYKRQSNGHVVREGQGIHTLPSGVTYNGQWKGDKMNGQGLMKHPLGDTYQGAFVDNEYHGVGVYTWANGAVYNGPFDHNRMIGEGEFVDSSGRHWVGEFAGKRASCLRLKISVQ